MVELAEERTRLAYERTKIASERTLLAWIRTAVALIGFGFSIPEFFRALRQMEGTETVSGQSAELGLVLIGLGILCVIGGAVEHIWLLKKVAPRDEARKIPLSPGLLLAALIGLVALYAAASVLFERLG